MASVFAREGLLIKHIWLGFIAITFITAAIWRWHGRKHIAEHPETAEGYRRLIRGFLLWGNVPWIVMGLGLTVGGVESIGAYARPSEANPWVIACYLSVIVLWALSLWWVFRRGGAQQLVDHPGFFNFPMSKPKYVKLMAVGGVVVGFMGMIFLFFDGMLPYWTSRGDGYTTVFIVYDGFWRVVAFGLLITGIGAAGVVFSIAWVRRTNMANWWHRNEAQRPVFVLAVSIIFLTVGGFGFALRTWDAYQLLRAYADGDAGVVEGTVHVVHEQPRGGHVAGDLVEIDGVPLRVDYFQITSAYKQTTSHGGALAEGAYVRVWHYDRRVLRIDLLR